MFAIDPLKHSKLYEEYGLYLRPHQINQEIKPTTIKKKELAPTIRSIKYASLIHSMLAEHAARHNGTLINPRMYADMITLGNTKVTVTKGTPKAQIDTLKMNGLTVVSKSRRNNKKKPVSDTTATIDENTNAIVTYKALTEMSTLIESFRLPSGLTLIIFDDEKYQSLIPNYINQLIAYTQPHIIPTWQGIADFSDTYLRSYFKRPFELTASNLAAPQKHNLSPMTRSIFNNTGREDAVIRKLYGYGEYVFIKYEGCLITWTGIYGEVTMMVNLSKRDLGLDVGDDYLKEYKKLLFYGVITDAIPSGISTRSTIMKISPHKMMNPSGGALAVLSKFLEAVVSTNVINATLVVYAEKGAGKTSFLSTYAEQLSLASGQVVGHLSSDAYGRWLAKTKDIEEPSFAYDYVLSLDTDDNESYYEQKASELLMSHGISEVAQYELLSVRKKIKMMDEMNEVLIAQLENADTHSERNFYYMVSTGKTTPRILIVEGHFNAQDATIARTDTTVLLRTINDTTQAMRDRQRGGVVQLFLRDTYYRLLPALHTTVYPFEMLESIKRWKWVH
ncbi:viral structural protein 4 [Bombyx mori cypovirus 1]|uniref:Viral structural protein 4 n=2 Tax=Cypovirus altineae TaxID=3428163 RepID=C7EWL9_CPVBM|nr:viral structural protein 4 [Bombyx mori cypovirus 1]